MSQDNDNFALRHVLYDPDIVEFNLAIHAGEGEELSRQEILNVLADRERYEFEQGLGKAIPDFTPKGLDQDPVSLVELMSAESYHAVVGWETGGKRYYERVLGAKPHWPGGRSGVTIGCGYDLGYHKREEFESDWHEYLGTSDMRRLLPAIGLRSRKARSFLPRVDDIRIPWGVALTVFDSTSLPKYVVLTFKHLPNLFRLAEGGLHGHCIGALVSLVFNRGPSFQRRGDRFREMRLIREAIESGRQQDLRAVPGYLRSMKRIWKDSGPRGLLVRREKEAQLFERGLDAMRIRESVPAGWSSTLGAAEALNEDSPEVFEALDALSEEELTEALYEPGSGEDFVESETAVSLEALARCPGRKSDVRWVRNDRNAPDYHHLPPDSKNTTFDFTSTDMERLIAANRFKPHTGDHDKILFGLRGCRLVGSGHAQEARTALRLKDVRPNHRAFRCVIGVYDRNTKQLSAYTASTVPNAHGVSGHYNRVNCQHRRGKANMLPTGCYELCVGTHAGRKIKVPGAFRLGNGPTPQENSSEATVLRTENDLTYGTKDRWDPGKPGDNVHPAFGDDRFISSGCLTVRGSYSRRRKKHTGEWAKFRAVAGLTAGIGDGTRFDIVLLTGLDAATVAMMRESGASNDEIDEAVAGLRHGSQGDEVKALQKKLGVSANGDFGPRTKYALTEAQRERLGYATGIYSVEMDGDMGFEVFGSALI